MQLLEFHELDIIGPMKGIFSETDSETDQHVNTTKFPSMESGDADKAQAVFYNPDKFQLLDHDSFTITHRAKSAEKGNHVNTRTCDWGKFKNLEDDRLFYVFNVQSIPNTAADEKKLILEKIRQINKEGLPYILTGDFYDTKPGLPTINSIHNPASPDDLKESVSMKSAG
ncbi:MAG: hypothetical protein JJU34_17070 [Lunatimonas sp.]|uniref:hypothetical protein n=1 Tax=Lunatimonas sp. TaxID=2060141 RepID=UPI00263B7835|nr:hypothetical protein [Lunatimonas sp.]MCC5938993.1 hypothetical protein [Lunatimonas sp.]